MSLLDRRLLIVGGKGGTGKSTVAAALAELSAFRGVRTLVISADGTPGAAGFFGVEPGYEAVEVRNNLSVLRIDPRSSLTQFVRLQLGPLGAIAGPVASALAFVAEAAPGVSELLLVGKYCHEVRSGEWGMVIVDAAASGHLLGELGAAGNVRVLVDSGRLGDETARILAILGDAEQAGVVNVTLAEELPVAETLDFVDQLHERTPARLAAVVVNRTRPQLYARSQRATLDELLAKPPKRLTQGAAGLLDAVEIGLDRADVAAAVDARLHRELPAGSMILHVPELTEDNLADDVREALADEMSM